MIGNNQINARFLKTIGQVDRGYLTESLMHLSSVYGVLSIAYYHHNTSLVCDQSYDNLCRFLYVNFDKAIAQKTSPNIIEKGMLKAGSGYNYENVDNLKGFARSLPNITDNLIKIYELV